MSDQMPDEVWTDNPLKGSGVYMTYPCGVCRHRYIRADLYEQAEAKRDRLRAAMEAAIAVLRNDLYTTRVREALARLQEALGHE